MADKEKLEEGVSRVAPGRVLPPPTRAELHAQNDEKDEYIITHGSVKVGSGDDARIVETGGIVELTERQAVDVGLDHLATREQWKKMTDAHDAQLEMEKDFAEAQEMAASLGKKVRRTGLPANMAQIRAAAEKKSKAESSRLADQVDGGKSKKR
jgi:hypothetical protein